VETCDCGSLEIKFMNLNDIWIGDYLKVVSRNAVGRFEGIHPNGHAKIKINDETFMISAHDLEPWKEPEEEQKWDFSELEQDRKKSGFQPVKSLPKLFDGIIDLHFEKLAPELLQNPPPHILEFQLKKCKEFVELAIQKKASYLRIIHGRGEGKLKAGVEHLLTGFREVNSFYATPDAGALEVRLQYHTSPTLNRMEGFTIWMVLLLASFLANACKDSGPEESRPTIGEVTIGCDIQLKDLLQQQEIIFERQYKHANVHLKFYDERTLVNHWVNDSFRTIVLGRALDSTEIRYFISQKQVTPRQFPFAVGAIALLRNTQNKDTSLRFEQFMALAKGEDHHGSSYQSLIVEDAASGIARYLLDWAGKEQFSGPVYALQSKDDIFRYLGQHPEAVAAVDWAAFSDSDDTEGKQKLNGFAPLYLNQPKDSIQSGFVLPDQYNLQDRKYPLQRTWHFISSSGKSDLALGFASFVAGEIGQKIVLKAGMLPIYQTERWVEWVPGDYKIVN